MIFDEISNAFFILRASGDELDGGFKHPLRPARRGLTLRVA